MQKLSDFILQSVPAKTKINNRRQFVISQFVEELNREREENRQPLFNPSFIAYKLSHLKVPELEYFYQTCRRYKLEKKGAFSKCFFGSLKVNK